MRFRYGTLMIGIGAIGLVACTAGAQDPIPSVRSDPAEEVTPSVTVSANRVVSDTGPEVEINRGAYDLDPNGVLLAAIIIMNGDVEQAVAAGVLRPVEVDVALLAMSSGTLDDWVEFLESTSVAQVRPAIRAHSSRRPTVRWNSSDSRSS